LPPTAPDSTPKAPSLWEPITSLRRVPIVDNGEPLVNFLDVCPDLLVDRPRFQYQRIPFARRSVAEMLCKADAALRSQGFRLAVVEVWRPPHIQRRMYLASWNWWKERHPDWSDTQMRRVVNRFTAPISDRRVPPPHTTGGAVDLLLADGMTGEPLDHSSPFDTYDPVNFPFAASGLSETALRHRRILAEALLPTGLTNYPSEYWHWSYGDQGWAYRGRHANALYGPTAPGGFVPSPEEVIDAPLERLPDP